MLDLCLKGFIQEVDFKLLRVGSFIQVVDFKLLGYLLKSKGLIHIEIRIKISIKQHETFAKK